MNIPPLRDLPERTPDDLRDSLVYFTKDEVAAMFRGTTAWVDRMTRSGSLRAARVGGKVLYSARTLAALAEAA
jgi:hypothetical protein